MIDAKTETSLIKLNQRADKSVGVSEAHEHLIKQLGEDIKELRIICGALNERCTYLKDRLKRLEANNEKQDENQCN